MNDPCLPHLLKLINESGASFDIEMLRPDADGAPPSIVTAIRDLKNPKKLKCRELPRNVVTQAWNDFETFYQERRPSAKFLRADSKKAKDRKAASGAEFLKQDCDWSY